jgi:aromatic ring-opening dioxygenase LigB subunit
MQHICGLCADDDCAQAQCMSNDVSPELASKVSDQIHVIRGHRVLLDSDLAALYSVATKALNQGVRRNIERFPADFLLQLTHAEAEILRSQIVTLRLPHGRHRKYPPLAFTEHGAIMAATILNSPRAVQMSVYVVRAFVRLRAMLASNAALARKLEDLEKSVAALDSDTRHRFDQVYEAILSLMGPAAKPQ